VRLRRIPEPVDHPDFIFEPNPRHDSSVRSADGQNPIIRTVLGLGPRPFMVFERLERGGNARAISQDLVDNHGLKASQRDDATEQASTAPTGAPFS
jgi:hypothetical protein